MKTVLRIARAELRNLFYSPVAWFLGVIFMIQCSVFYTSLIYTLAKNQELYAKNPKFEGFRMSLTRAVYLNADGLFSSVMQNLYLFIPLLTMGILSREVSNGSIKLLYSSPIKTRHIVFGKYLSLVLCSLVLIVIVGIFMVIGAFNIKSVDYGLLLAASLGFFLLVCAYAAIGLFMSSLTTYQIVSAIGTFIVIFVLSRIGGLWQEIDFVRDLTYFLSMNGRTAKMLNGLITTKDVFYFLLVISMFLGFTLIKLKSGRTSTRWYIKTGKYAGIIVVTLALGYISSRPKFIGYWDTTAAQSNTIHPRVQKILKDLGDEPLEVTLYTNLLGGNMYAGLPKNRNAYLSGMWEKYIRFKHDIEFKYEYYYDAKPGNYIFRSYPNKKIDEIAKDYAKSGDLDLSLFKGPAAMKRTIDLEPEDFNLVMQLKYRGKTTFLRTFPMPVWPGEEHVAAAIARLQGVKPPEVLYVNGNLERDISVQGERGFSGHTIAKASRESLINNGFDIDSISLDTQDIPADRQHISALVLADPKTELSPVVKEKINAYLESGGNMLIVGEPGKEDMLNPVLKPLGVQLTKGVLVQTSNKNNSPDMFNSYLTRAAGGLAEENPLLALKNGKNDDTLNFLSESFAPIEYIDSNTAFTRTAISMTYPGQNWLKKGRLVKDSLPPVLNAAEGDSKLGSYVTTVALTRKVGNKEQRIVIGGDADFLSNRFRSGGYFGRALYSWLNNNEYPIYGPVPPLEDDVLLTTPTAASRYKIVFTWIIPAILVLLGTTILVRRKRK